jgi:hypothetical protein
LTADRDAIREALKRGAEWRAEWMVPCDTPGCRMGFVAPDPDDIDSFTGEPRRVKHTRCDAVGFIHRQYDLFPETLNE